MCLLVAYPFLFSRRPFLIRIKETKKIKMVETSRDWDIQRGREAKIALWCIRWSWVGWRSFTNSLLVYPNIYSSHPQKNIYGYYQKKGGCNTQETYTNINSGQRATQLFFFLYSFKTVDWLKRSTKKKIRLPAWSVRQRGQQRSGQQTDGQKERK